MIQDEDVAVESVLRGAKRFKYLISPPSIFIVLCIFPPLLPRVFPYKKSPSSALVPSILQSRLPLARRQAVRIFLSGEISLRISSQIGNAPAQ